ncbi:hypothetical protein ACFY1B_49850 [Streptomyces mirabilis]|uniref:hypothetical protein n=1 Tax=Streptomyces mirabilis TaxID=68239 RepID=UPI0033322FAD
MAPTLPRTIRAVDTEQLLDLEREAGAYGFSQRLPVDWLRDDLLDGDRDAGWEAHDEYEWVR